MMNNFFFFLNLYKIFIFDLNFFINKEKWIIIKIIELLLKL